MKLGDFGLVKPTGLKGTDVTALGELIGTPHYMSPEQSRGTPLDERSDIYSLGATYFALLTGRPPFNSPDSVQVLFHTDKPGARPPEVVPGIPERCTAVVRRAMAKGRGERHASAGELLADLGAVLGPHAATTTPKPPAPRSWRGTSARADDALSLADEYPGERSQSRRRPTRRTLIGPRASGRGRAHDRRRRRPEAAPDGRAPEPAPAVPDDWRSTPRHGRGQGGSREKRGRHAGRAGERPRPVQNRQSHQDPAQQARIRETLARLEKALAFRASVTERGLVLGLPGPVTSVDTSPDDRWLAVGQSYGDAGAFVFDSYTGEKRHRPSGRGGAKRWSAFRRSPRPRRHPPRGRHRGHDSSDRRGRDRQGIVVRPRPRRGGFWPSRAPRRRATW